MGDKAAEQMMGLLKELAILKELDQKHEDAGDPGEVESRETRRREITDRIKSLGGQ